MKQFLFSAIYENFVNRHGQGGFLQGDYVKLTANAVKCPDLNPETKKVVREIAKSGARLRIVAIQPRTANLVAAPNLPASELIVTLAPEIHPGLNGGIFVVPMSCIELETKTDDAAQKEFEDSLTGKGTEDYDSSAQKFSDIYDSGKGTQTDFGKI